MKIGCKIKEMDTRHTRLNIQMVQKINENQRSKLTSCRLLKYNQKRTNFKFLKKNIYIKTKTQEECVCMIACI